jgi:hypothetical protein
LDIVFLALVLVLPLLTLAMVKGCAALEKRK